MKIIVTENNYPPATSETPGAWFLIADSAITNTGKPFYMPEHNQGIEVQLGLVVKICRLGKHIAPKFVSRYYTEMAPVVHFTNIFSKTLLKSFNLPIDAAHNFDKSLFVGEFFPKEEAEPITLKINDREVLKFDLTQVIKPIDQTISALSNFNSMKMGDLIIPALTPPVEIKKGDFLEVCNQDSTLFSIRIK